jgi:hypothetical protein
MREFSCNHSMEPWNVWEKPGGYQACRTCHRSVQRRYQARVRDEARLYRQLRQTIFEFEENAA